MIVNTKFAIMLALRRRGMTDFLENRG
jgi:hypothetical protein